MRIGPYRFQPTFIATILVFVGIVILIRLGNWQLVRATEKEKIINDIESRKISDPLTLTALNQLAEKNYYPLKIQGYFDNQHYLLLDNRIYKGRAGFEVVQPFISTEGTVLVNRGWIPWPLYRAILPKIPIVVGMMELEGEVSFPLNGIVLVKDELKSTNGWPQLVQSLDISALTKLYQEINLSIEPWILRQRADSEPFYKRSWIYINMSPEKHVSYAVTWFGLALALIIIYIAAVTSREESTIATD